MQYRCQKSSVFLKEIRPTISNQKIALFLYKISPQFMQSRSAVASCQKPDQTKFLILLHSASLTQLHSGCLLSTSYQFFRVEEVIFRSDVDSALSIITLLLDDSSIMGSDGVNEQALALLHHRITSSHNHHIYRVGPEKKSTRIS